MNKLTLIALIVCLAFFSISCSRRESGPARTELRFGLATEPVTFDPLNPANTADGRSILFNVFEGLVKPDSYGNLIPAIAESYEREETALAYVFTLRPGVLFHDGTALSPSDIVFSLNTAIRARFSGLDNIEGIEITPQGKIRISLKEPDPEFLPYLTIGIVPKNTLTGKEIP